MKKHKYTDNQLKEAVEKSDNMYDVIREIGGSLTSGALYRHLKKRIFEAKINTSHFKRPTDVSAKHSKYSPGKVLVYNRRNGIRERTFLLKRAMIESGIEEKCECGQGKIWNQKPLVLQIDHIDGDCLNNKINNLRFLCPNCHSQTGTYGKKGKSVTMVE